MGSPMPWNTTPWMRCPGPRVWRSALTCSMISHDSRLRRSPRRPVAQNLHASAHPTCELTHTENKIGFSRQFFNDTVLSYNNSIQSFPGMLFARIYGRQNKQMLTIPEAERAVPKVAFA